MKPIDQPLISPIFLLQCRLALFFKGGKENPPWQAAGQPVKPNLR
jgi:hypothetical protein